MKPTVSTYQNIPLIVFKRSLDIEELIPALEELDLEIKTQNAKGILADIDELKHISIESRKYGSNWLNQHTNLKVAVHGKTLFMKHFINMMVAALGIKKSMRYFNTRENALEWLELNEK